MRRYLLLLPILLFSLASQAQTQEVFGVITDILGEPLVGATVVVIDTTLATYTDADGEFRIKLAAGDHTLEVAYLGYRTVQKKVTLQPEDKSFVQIELVPSFIESEEIVVYGRIIRGQVQALNSQRTALNIRNVVHSELFNKYPDINLAETVQRLPGATITRNRGEGEFVQVRGLPEEFISLAINGQRLPSLQPEAGRAVGLDLVQSSLIEEVRLIKALTPDMDGDAIGGMIDFRLKEPANDPQFNISGGYGYNQQESFVSTFPRNIFQGSVFLTQRISDNKLGLLIAGSYYDTQRGSVRESWRYSAPTGQALTERRVYDYDVHRVRYGMVIQADYRLSHESKIKFGYNVSGYRDDEIRRQAQYDFANNREGRFTRNRLQEQSVFLFTLNGISKFNKVKVDYHVAFSDGEEDVPDRTSFQFERGNDYEGLSADNRFSLDPLTPFNLAPLSLTQVRSDLQNNNELVLNAGMDFTIETGPANKLRLGGKLRGTDRLFGIYRNVAFPNPNNPAPTLDGGTFGFADNRFSDADVRALPLNNQNFSGGLYQAEDAYEAQEDVYSGYAMTTTNWTKKFTSLVGVRVENTNTDYVQSVSDRRGSSSYTNVLPSAHFTLRFNDNSQLRAAYSESLSRVPFSTLVPFESIDANLFEIRRGNTQLEPVEARNIDLMYENYGRRLSAFTAGLFYKSLNDPIITVGTLEQRDNRLFTIFQATNGSTAKVFGAELSFYQNLARLLPALRNFNVNANYTFTKSQADFGTLSPDELPLVHSPQHSGNLSFVFDSPTSGLSFVLAGVFRDFMLDKFENGDAIWLNRTLHLDFSGSFTWPSGLGVFLRLNNLTNQPDKEINGKPNSDTARLHERESYGLWGTVGFRFNFSRPEATSVE